jgi:hypothetical protein
MRTALSGSIMLLKYGPDIIKQLKKLLQLMSKTSKEKISRNKKKEIKIF